MAKKGNDKGSHAATKIKPDTRGRHIPDRAEGRIVWANSVAVKLQWDVGDKVT